MLTTTKVTIQFLFILPTLIEGILLGLISLFFSSKLKVYLLSEVDNGFKTLTDNVYKLMNGLFIISVINWISFFIYLYLKTK